MPQHFIYGDENNSLSFGPHFNATCLFSPMHLHLHVELQSFFVFKFKFKFDINRLSQLQEDKNSCLDLPNYFYTVSFKT